jgi:hypothetical protein
MGFESNDRSILDWFKENLDLKLKSIAFVFDQLTINLLCLSQAQINSKSCVRVSRSKFILECEKDIVVSSANKKRQDEILRKHRSFIKIIKSNGPRIEP